MMPEKHLMNRAQRRKLEPNTTLQANLKFIIERNRLDATKQACELMTAVIAEGLHIEFGFGVERINRTLDAARQGLARLHEGTVTVEELLAWCRDYGVKL